jgi:hypothetical protein
MLTLHWIGKEKVIKHHMDVPLYERCIVDGAYKLEDFLTIIKDI